MAKKLLKNLNKVTEKVKRCTCGTWVYFDRYCGTCLILEINKPRRESNYELTEDEPMKAQMNGETGQT
jgi:hypothetical protein